MGAADVLSLGNQGFAVYLTVINLVTFAAFGIDKDRAVHNKWRIPEARLLTLAVFGGSVGALLGMHFFHHKTRKPKFRVGVPLILAVQAAAAYCLR